MARSPNFQLPLDGSCYVSWVGHDELTNNSPTANTVRGSFDFIPLGPKNEWHANDGTELDDYYGYGQDVLAPAFGKVVQIVDKITETPVGTTHPRHALGNNVLIKHVSPGLNLDEHFVTHSIIANLRPGILARPGSYVLPGQKIGECGKSGWARLPQVRFIHFMGPVNQLSLIKSYVPYVVASGIETCFSNLAIIDACGVERTVSVHFPKRGEILSNAG